MGIIEFNKTNGPSYEDSLNRGRTSYGNSSLVRSFDTQQQQQPYRDYGYRRPEAAPLGQYSDSDSALANLYKNQDARAERSTAAFNNTRYINTALSGVGLIGQIFDNIGKQKIRDSQLKSLDQNRNLARKEYDHLVNYRNKLTTSSKNAFKHIFNKKQTSESTDQKLSFKRGI